MDGILKDIHKCLLDIAKDFHNVCLQNNLTYYIIGGTFLGAIRHNGFIPWDDDIDIGMPREDYERFVKLPNTALPRNLIRLNAGYGNDKRDFLYLKLCDRRTTLVESVNEKRIEGIYIDIFPIDGAHSTLITSRIKYYYSRIYIYAIWLNASEKQRNNPLKRIIQVLFKTFDNQTIYDRANKMLAKTKYKKSKYIGNFMGNWGIKEIMRKDILGEPILYKFEDTMLFGPEKYNEFLSTVYGNYMELPPEEKRKSHHTYEYINLKLGYEEYAKQDKVY